MSVVYAISNECPVCKDPKAPADLLLLECGHFACLQCLRDAKASPGHETFCYACEELTMLTSLPGSLVMGHAEAPPDEAEPPAKRVRAEDVLDPASLDVPKMRSRLWDRYGWQLIQAENVLERLQKNSASVLAHRDRMCREIDELYFPRVAMFETAGPQPQPQEHCRRLKLQIDDFFHKLLKPRQMTLEEVLSLRERVQRKRDIVLQLDCLGVSAHAGGLEWLCTEADDWDPLILKMDWRSTFINDETQCLFFNRSFFRRLAMKSADFLGRVD